MTKLESMKAGLKYYDEVLKVCDELYYVHKQREISLSDPALLVREETWLRRKKLLEKIKKEENK